MTARPAVRLALARMAAARAAAGQPLTELDRQALHLEPGAPDR